MTSSASTATPMKHDFSRQVDEVRLPKSDINELILDYLTMAGYPNAAARFSAEANLRPQQDHPSIVARLQIQRSIQQGDIEAAIDSLNELDPEILDKDPPLHFALLRLQLVEIIRTCTQKPDCDVGPALEFASEKLGPRAPTNPQFLEDLEKTMTLLVFSHDPKTLDPSLAALLKADLRREVADEVNKAIVGRQLNRRDAAIRHLVQMRAWAENTVRKDALHSLPARIDLGLNGEDVDKNGQDVDMT